MIPKLFTSKEINSSGDSHLIDGLSWNHETNKYATRTNDTRYKTCLRYNLHNKLLPEVVPRVWSDEGPVLAETVRPACFVQSNTSPERSLVKPQSPLSKSHVVNVEAPVGATTEMYNKIYIYSFFSFFFLTKVTKLVLHKAKRKSCMCKTYLEAKDWIKHWVFCQVIVFLFFQTIIFL